MRRYRLLSTAILLSLLCASTSFAQRKVLLETFTNYTVCPAADDFANTVRMAVDNKGSKIVHLSHHVADNDVMARPGVAHNSQQTDFLLAGLPPSNSNIPVFVGSVDRTSVSGVNRETGDEAAWESKIDAEYSQATEATLSLVNATLDKANASSYVLHADIDVTAQQFISDTLKIRYALTEDNISYPLCSGGTAIDNDVVRYITLGDSIVFMPNTASGTTKRVSYTQNILMSTQVYKPQNMKLVAFLEDANGDFHVVNASILKADLDTLKPPVGMLSLVASSVDNMTFHPGDIVAIKYQSSNVPKITASYSLDNGQTWRVIGAGIGGTVNWNVPDSTTTQGKIKVEGPNGVPSSVQAGNFIIAAPAHSLKVLKPAAKDTVYARQQLKIVWTAVGVPAVKIQYSLDDGVTYTTIKDNFSGDTSYMWTIPDTISAAARIALTPIGITDVPQMSSEAFVIMRITGGGVAETYDPAALRIDGLFPNPASNVNSIAVNLQMANAANVLVQIYDVNGREVYRASQAASSSQVLSIPVQSLASGSYVLHVTDGRHAAVRSFIR